jgi:hypothetical protein
MNISVASRKIRKSKTRSNYPPSWKFLKINAPDSPAPGFIDFLNIMKHPWLNYSIYKCTHFCRKIVAIKHAHGNHFPTWIEGTMAVYMLTHIGEFVITKWYITQVNNSNVAVTEEEYDKKIMNKLEVYKGNDEEVDIEINKCFGMVSHLSGEGLLILHIGTRGAFG